jgi:hypothetical protein
VQRALESYACKLLCSSNNPLRKPSGSLPYHSFALNSFLHRYSIAPLIRSLNFLHITSRMTSQQPASIAREHERSDIHAHAKAQTQTHTHNGTHAASGSCQATCHRLAPNLEVHTLIHMAHTHKQTHTHTHTRMHMHMQKVDRANLLATSLHQIQRHSAHTLAHRSIAIKFRGEEGTGSGVVRDWLTQVIGEKTRVCVSF